MAKGSGKPLAWRDVESQVSEQNIALTKEVQKFLIDIKILHLYFFSTEVTDY